MAPAAADTDWLRIAARYRELEELTGSPVVRLNRAVAVAEADGPQAGLALLDGLELAGHRLPAVRGQLLLRARPRRGGPRRAPARPSRRAATRPSGPAFGACSRSGE